MILQEKKRKIREALLKKLREHKEEDRRKKSLKIARKLFGLKEFLKAKTVLFYLTMDGEVQTEPMIQEAVARGKKVAIPLIQKDKRDMIPSLIEDVERELKTGPYGVRHPKDEYIRPIPPESIDLVVVPGIAFDGAGNRLGRGMGYYDKFLSRLPDDIPTVGLAFDFQILRDFPPLEAHDFAVSKVLFA